MPVPPVWLVAWTNYLSLLAGTVTAVRALVWGGTALRFKATELRNRPGKLD
jgi:hypothetical protein